MPRPLVAQISLAAMRHNLAVARNKAPGSRVWAVVKANAYGHRLMRGMQAFSAADGLALIEPESALRLRELGWQKPILLLEGFFDADDLDMAVQHRIDVAIHSNEQIVMLERLPAGSRMNVHLKMNSGMNRLGIMPDQYRDAHARLRANPAVGAITLMTHFANADDMSNPGLPMDEQVRRFEAASAGLPGERSLSNSAAVLAKPAVAADWIRPGIMLYGGTPGGASAEHWDLKPAMTLKSEIISVQQVRQGQAVGYGSRFIAEQDMLVGVVACGYADGYPRHAPNGTPVLVNGMRTRVIGRVSMDMITVDLGGIPDAHVGSEVTLWGRGLPIDEVANAAGTIGYELMCAIAPRVRMVEAD